MRNLKRVFCLFLALLSLSTSAFAVSGAGQGAFSIGAAGGDIGTGFGTSEALGISIGIQQMSGEEFKVRMPTKELQVAIDQAHSPIGSKGMANVFAHFAQSYPNPYEPPGEQGTLYILPNIPSVTDRDQYVYCVDAGGICNRAPMQNELIVGSYTPAHALADKLYDIATKRVSEANPNPSFTAADFANIRSYINYNDAKNTIGAIFGFKDYGSMELPTFLNRNLETYCDYNPDRWKEGSPRYTARQVSNYAAVLLYLAYLLPESGWSTYLSYVRDYACGSLGGSPYSPVVITLELCTPTQWPSDNVHDPYIPSRTWRSASEHLALKAAVALSTIRDVPANLPGALSEMLVRDNPSRAIYTTALATGSNSNSYKSPGSERFIGLRKSGADWEKGYYGRNITSVETRYLEAAREAPYNLNIPTQGPWGCGVFGAENCFTPRVPVPSVKVAANGIIGLYVEDTSYVKPVGGYSETVTVSIPVKLDTSGFIFSETLDNVSKVVEDSGPGFANSLRWLANKRAAGATFEDPFVNIWLARSKDVNALSDSAASKLIEDSDGYHENGTRPSSTDKLDSWSPPSGEAGIDFGWEMVELVGTSAVKLPNIDGLEVKKTGTGEGIKLLFHNLEAAADYFQTNSAIITIQVEVPINGTLDSEDSVKQHWFKTGSSMRISGPASLSNMDSVVQRDASLFTYPKYAYTTIATKPEDKPFYYSKVRPAYSELKQGTVPASGGGSSETFNSMTGTPTFTDTSVRVDFTGTPYADVGRYYQYFASGGSEFVVQFDGEYVESANASRTYTATFSNVQCSLWKSITCVPCPGHPTKDGPPSYCACCCSGCDEHHSCKEHYVGDTFTWSQSVTGFSYVKITNLKVWKLSEAKLDGTRELLDTNEVTASVLSTAPSVSYNIAGADTAAEGRLIYSYNTNQKDTAKINGYPKSSDNSCSSHRANNQKTLDGDTAGLTCNAICVSDFIVLRTSNGDQSILYYEYKSKNEAAINKGNCVAEAIEFDKVPYETIWRGNSKTSAGCGLPDDGITYGGYNGNYSSMSTKYKSMGHASNIDFNTTEVYKKRNTMSGSWDAVTDKPTQKFRLLNDTLVIPDYKQNGEYIVGESQVFYENIINYGSKTPNYPIVPQADFGGKRGFTLKTTYSPSHDKINDVVVYNPVSTQNAIVVSLPPERDQRVSTHVVTAVDKATLCPGDASCPYLENECTVTEHIHTEACYERLAYEVHGPNNVHEHTSECYANNTQGMRHIHCISGCRDFMGYCTGAGCTLCAQNVPFDNNTYPNDVGAGGGVATAGRTIKLSNGQSVYISRGSGKYIYLHTYGCSYAGEYHASPYPNRCSCDHYSCTPSPVDTYTGYTCNNLPLNKHSCTVTTVGQVDGAQSKTYNYTGGQQSVTLQPGTYVLEAWGAAGGNPEHGAGGGYGGYSKGTLTITSPTTLYINCGALAGSYNGGGYGYSSDGTYGGGATSIATASGQLSSLAGNRDSILLVAGGGGSGGCSGWHGGAGGGANQNGQAGYGGSDYGAGGYGGTLSSSSNNSGSYGAGFGQGGNSSSGLYGSGGGGGGYYGGSAGENQSGGGTAGGGGSGYANTSKLTSISGNSGANSGAGYVKITAQSTTKDAGCYTRYKSLLQCTDPHHAYSYNWKIFTYGLKHDSGNICTGRSCSDTSALLFPTQKRYTVAQCAAGYIVRHTNGDVHLTTTTGTCSYCGSTYAAVLSAAQSTDRVPAESEYSCFAYGDLRCWTPCNDNSKHQKIVTEVVDNGTTYSMGNFINLDWPFTIYFPNTGDFYGTGARSSAYTSSERGAGYSNGMDATEWTKSKWVEFPFAVVYNNTTYLAHERIYLSVPQTTFEFYVPLHDNEMANAEIKFGSVAINTQCGDNLECGPNADHNIANISYSGKPKAHHHNADKRTYIDVVGRIGNLTLNDTGDFRYANFFKQPTSGWIVQNIVHTVDPTKQNNIVMDPVDVRGVNVGATGVGANTHNTRPERGRMGLLHKFPLIPSMNNITALQRQPIRIGYDSYFDLTTLGNYYGNTIYDEDGNETGKNLVLIKPHYYRLDLDTGAYKPVDVYMDINGNKVLINDNDRNTVAYNGTDTQVNLNWVEEQARRNYTGSEVTSSNAVASANDWVELPHGSSWVYGNYNILNLTQRNRTFVGSEYTYVDTDTWVAHKDPSERLPNTGAALQGGRWHFNVGLPSSSVFVYSGQAPSQANIDACSSGNAVIFCALEIYAQGEVWTLAYDGSNVNKPFKVLPDGPTYDPVVPYPTGRSPKNEEMPIVEIISINHSSKEDLNTIGTQ